MYNFLYDHIDPLEEELHETFFTSLKRTTRSCIISYTIAYNDR